MTARCLGVLRRSKATPRIVVVAPASKGRLGPTAIVRWKAFEGGSSGSKLRFQVAYSPDGGTTFVPVGVDITGSRLRFDARQVRRTRGKGLMRVFVSDGLNTRFADVAGLTNTFGLR